MLYRGPCTCFGGGALGVDGLQGFGTGAATGLRDGIAKGNSQIMLVIAVGGPYAVCRTSNVFGKVLVAEALGVALCSSCPDDPTMI
jgi:hypothetical protein